MGRPGHRRGVGLITATLAAAPVGPYQLQAAIAAVHDEAARFEDTDWRRILGLYDLLRAIAPVQMVTLNRVVAAAMVHGPRPASRNSPRRRPTPPSPRTTGSTPSAPTCSRWPVTGRRRAPRSAAARHTLSLPERRYLESRGAGLAPD